MLGGKKHSKSAGDNTPQDETLNESEESASHHHHHKKSPVYDDYYDDSPSFVYQDEDSFISNFGINSKKGEHVRRPSILKKAGSLAQKNRLSKNISSPTVNRGVSFRDSNENPSSPITSIGNSINNFIETTDTMKMIDENHVVIIDDEETETNQTNPTEYYTSRDGNSKMARDRYSIDELAMQPKIVMSRQSIRLLKNVIPKKREERTWRHRLYLLMNQPQSSKWAFLIAIIVNFIVLISVIVLILESFAELYQFENTWWIIEGILAFFFTVEYMLRLIGNIYSKKDAKYFFFNIMNLIDLMSFIPYYLEVVLYYIFRYSLGQDHYITSMVMNLQIIGVFRVLRLLKVFTLTKHSGKVRLLLIAIRRSVDLLLAVIYFVIATVFILGTLIYYAERGTFDHELKAFVRFSPLDGKTKEISPFSNILMGMWYSLISITTTGYGDMIPVTIIGKLIGTISILTGLLIVALPSMIIGRTYSEVLHQYEMEKLELNLNGGTVDEDDDSALEDEDEQLDDSELTLESIQSAGAKAALSEQLAESNSVSGGEPEMKIPTSQQELQKENDQIDQSSLFMLLDEQDKILLETLNKIEKTRRLIQASKRKTNTVD
ncbi:predicted protein [Naegleria gruberi]|uniref:Predicted protein n=1 Tax=Naegleria gruberi TaxID=5762 RepID=D2VZK4_NAEGR|nr:uncharacterized protein NAEGRDRAFT_81831 [Naegleria gruberi]EFC37717.1 predicted protein [Naegleria gruberi]|eukprot:XP_002670461.1 predicted protein [Naegleria gruberi strain NEG-M]